MARTFKVPQPNTSVVADITDNDTIDTAAVNTPTELESSSDSVSAESTDTPTASIETAPATTAEVVVSPVIDRITAVATDMLTEYKSLATMRTLTNAQLKSMAVLLTQVVNYGLNPKKDTFHTEVMTLLYSFIKENIKTITNDNHLYRGFNLLNNAQNESGMLTSRVLGMLSAHAKGRTDYVWEGLKSSVTPAIYNKLRLLVK